MSTIHADEINEYYTETKILQPYSAYLLQGNVVGDTYAAQFFPIIREIAEKENYSSFINIKFDIHYTQCGEMHSVHIDTYKLRTECGDVTELIQSKFDELQVPISCTIRSIQAHECEVSVRCQACNEMIDYIVFQSSEEGYSFHIHSLFVSAIGSDYTNFDGSWSDYTESPFIGANINFDYICDLIRNIAPRKKGEYSGDDYTRIPCDIYKYLISIAPLAQQDLEAFSHNLKALKEFSECFDKVGNIIEDKQTQFVFLTHMYNDIYQYYWAEEYGILNKYNIHDVIKLLQTTIDYVNDSNVSGPYRLVEDYDKRIYPTKYPNGAFRGMVLIPDWNEATDAFSCIKLNHVSDNIFIDEKIKIPSDMHVEGFVCNECVDVYRKVCAAVKINTLLQEEMEIYKECDCNLPLRKVVSNETLATCLDETWTYDTDLVPSDNWTNNPSYSDGSNIWSDSVSVPTKPKQTHGEHHKNNHAVYSDDEYLNEFNVPSKYDFLARVPKHVHGLWAKSDERKTIGLYRYMQYLNENELWTKVGQAYMIVGAKDDYQSKVKNLHNSTLIYNPNNVPVKIRFMVFS